MLNLCLLLTRHFALTWVRLSFKPLSMQIFLLCHLPLRHPARTFFKLLKVCNNWTIRLLSWRRYAIIPQRTRSKFRRIWAFDSVCQNVMRCQFHIVLGVAFGVRKPVSSWDIIRGVFLPRIGRLTTPDTLMHLITGLNPSYRFSTALWFLYRWQSMCRLLTWLHLFRFLRSHIFHTDQDLLLLLDLLSRFFI